MPSRNRKKFIDKKKAVTFHLVHRSQKDPLQADEEAPKHVLLPQQVTKDKRKEEQLKYGICFEDDYDYLQHLKDSRELQDVAPIESFRLYAKEDTKPKEPQIILPSSVFGLDCETDVGLLNKAAPLRGPQPDWDPDIVEALDDDFDFDNPNNELEDDFFVKANEEELHDIRSNLQDQEKVFRPQIEELDDEHDDDEDCYPSDEADISDNEDNISDIGSLGEQSFMSAETKTRFTNYSMSSSIIKRNDGLTLLDDRFEQVFAQYDDTEIGALDQEEITGFIKENDLLLNDALEQWAESTKVVAMKDVIEKGEVVSGSDSSDDDMIEVPETKAEDKWDCESILSTYSNLYNHPKLIVEPSKKVNPIKLTKRLGIPDDVLPHKGPTLKQLEKEDRQQRQIDVAPTFRPKNETAEDKKARKQAVKAQRRDRREEKKMNTAAFKQEQQKQQREIMNLSKNLQGAKIL